MRSTSENISHVFEMSAIPATKNEFIPRCICWTVRHTITLDGMLCNECGKVDVGMIVRFVCVRVLLIWHVQ